MEFKKIMFNVKYIIGLAVFGLLLIMFGIFNKTEPPPLDAKQAKQTLPIENRPTSVAVANIQSSTSATTENVIPGSKGQWISDWRKVTAKFIKQGMEPLKVAINIADIYMYTQITISSNTIRLTNSDLSEIVSLAKFRKLHLASETELFATLKANMTNWTTESEEQLRDMIIKGETKVFVVMITEASGIFKAGTQCIFFMPGPNSTGTEKDSMSLNFTYRNETANLTLVKVNSPEGKKLLNELEKHEAKTKPQNK